MMATRRRRSLAVYLDGFQVRSYSKVNGTLLKILDAILTDIFRRLSSSLINMDFVEIQINGL